MSEKTYHWANGTLNNLTGKTRLNIGAPTLRLYTTKPGVDGTGGVEVTGGSYVAQTFTSDMAMASNGSTSNTVQISFPTATASWGTVVAIGIYDADNGGVTATIDVPSGGKLISNGDQFIIPVGALVLSET